MPRSLLLLGAALFAGCASVPPAAPPASHPAAPEAAPAVARATLAPLPAAEAPDVPAILRPVAAQVATSGMHAGHGEMPSEVTAPSPLAEALDAYLAVHDALASDRLDGIAGQAEAFRVAFAAAIEVAPADDPHLWHMRSAETAAVLDAATRLAEAGDLEAARTAFAALSQPLADLAEAVPMPAGYALVRYTCGMRSGLPGGGVWLQRAGDVRNPYFGSAMAMCGELDASSSGEGHDAHGDHGTH